MVPIVVDVHNILNTISITKTRLEELQDFVLSQVSTVASKTWVDLANKHLGSTKEVYVKGMKITTLENNVILSLDGELPNKIEQGSGAWDMKSSMSKSPKVNYSRSGGWFVKIPFQWDTLGTKAGTVSVSARIKGKIFKASLRNTSKGVVLKPKIKPSELSGLSKMLKESSPKQGNRYLKYMYSQPITSGVKISSDQSVKTFRTIGDKSSPSAWIHPGFTAKNLLGKLIQEMDVDKIVRDAFVDFSTLTNT